MTDVRVPERWLTDRRIQRLTPEHYRSYFNSLMYAVANRSDGVIEPEDLGLITGFAANAAKALVDCGLWSPRAPKGWLISDYRATQTSRDEMALLERNRERERIKKANQRAGKSGTGTGSESEQVNPDVPGDSPGDILGGQAGDVSPGTAQEGRKAGRQAGQEGEQSSHLFAVNGGIQPSTFIQNH